MALSAPSGWLGRLEIDYRRDGERTIAHDRHHGPLRVLQPLYPEGPAVCHHVLVHPPGGVVGGDRLEVGLDLGAGSRVVVTTPGATRFYRSGGQAAAQSTRLRVSAGARLEWLPLEAIAFPGCDAGNELRFDLEADAEMIGWDLLVLGLPASGAEFRHGSFRQCLHWPGHWLERATLAADDRLLLDGPLGLAGHPVLATLWWAAGVAGAGDARFGADAAALADAARAIAERSPLAAHCGTTALEGGLVVLRVLAERVEPAFALLRAVRAAWRSLRWGLPGVEPRVWRT